MTAAAWVYVLGLTGLLGVPTVLIFTLLYRMAPGVKPEPAAYLLPLPPRNQEGAETE